MTNRRFAKGPGSFTCVYSVGTTTYNDASRSELFLLADDAYRCFQKISSFAITEIAKFEESHIVKLYPQRGGW